MKSFLSLVSCCRERLHEKCHSFEDYPVNKTPYPTNLEVVLFLADVFDVRDKEKRLYKASKKPLRHRYYGIHELVENYVRGPLKDRMESRVDGVDDYDSFGFCSMGQNIFMGFESYGRLHRDVNVGDMERAELMPVLIEEVFIPWAVYFMLSHQASSLYRVLHNVVDGEFCEDLNIVREVDGYLSNLYDGEEYFSGKPFPSSFPAGFLACVYPGSTGVGKQGKDAFNRMRTPSNTTIINIAKDLKNIKYQEPGERVFSDQEIYYVAGYIFFGAVFNRCLDRAGRGLWRFFGVSMIERLPTTRMWTWNSTRSGSRSVFHPC